jgi:hypothetical protein
MTKRAYEKVINIFFSKSKSISYFHSLLSLSFYLFIFPFITKGTRLFADFAAIWPRIQSPSIALTSSMGQRYNEEFVKRLTISGAHTMA